MTAQPAAMPGVAIPASHRDLFERAICAVLTTVGREGQPHSTLVWVDADDAGARVNSTLERQQGRNLLANPRASLLVVDPANTARFIQVRGDIELVFDGAVAHLDGLTRKYTRHPHFYGHIYPREGQGQETRFIGRLHARRVTLDAIHA
jgi:PPOX class probable F420-dependent enzyme